MNFFDSTLTVNNLGGVGPDSDMSRPWLLYENVGAMAYEGSIKQVLTLTLTLTLFLALTLTLTLTLTLFLTLTLTLTLTLSRSICGSRSTPTRRTAPTTVRTSTATAGGGTSARSTWAAAPPQTSPCPTRRPVRVRVGG